MFLFSKLAMFSDQRNLLVPLKLEVCLAGANPYYAQRLKMITDMVDLIAQLLLSLQPHLRLFI